MEVHRDRPCDQVHEGGDLSGTCQRVVNRLCCLGIAGAVLVTPDCGGESRAVALPSLTDSGTPRPSLSNADEEHAVASAYTKFVAMLDRADSLPAEFRKRDLATVMVDPQLSHVLRRIEEMKKQHIATYGQVAVRIKSVQITASGATVFDCQDSSNAGILHSVTGKKINRGVREGNTKALLVRGLKGSGG